MGGALGAALKGGLGTAIVVAGLVVLPAAPADAVSTARPIAVAVADDGTSYAGYAAGGRLLRLDRNGEPAGSVPLDRDDPVTALDVTPDGNIWVYYGATVTELTPTGEVLTAFSTLPGGSCPVDRAHDPTRYGGIDVYGGTVYVAGRCSATVRMYNRDGDLQATLDLPGSAYPRDVVSAPATKGLPARTYVSVPDAGKVYAYNTGGLRNDPSPAKTLVIKRFFGYRKPVPGALAADEKGQLAVVDVENNAVHFFNGPDDYWYYRTLGHPPEPGLGPRLPRPADRVRQRRRQLQEGLLDRRLRQRADPALGLPRHHRLDDRRDPARCRRRAGQHVAADDHGPRGQGQHAHVRPRFLGHRAVVVRRGLAARRPAHLR